MKWYVTSAAAVFLLGAMLSSASGRGGGGCLERGSSVLTPSGPVAVEDLEPGDTVLSFADGRLLAAQVQAVSAVDAEAYFELAVAGRVLRLTGEHPVATAPGVFRTARALRAGDRVLVRNQDAVADAAVESVERLPAKAPAYNLLVSPGGTYLANGIVVHNKGCFLPETLVREEDGSEVPISSVRPKDRLLAFTIEGQAVSARVRTVVACEVDEYRVVKTRNITVQVTREHPFYVGNGTFKTLQALKVGDSIFAFDAEGLSAQPIESIATVHKKVLVYNLQTDAPNTFLANGFLVHNKGGGGGGGGGGGFHGGGGGGGGFHGGSGSSGDSGPLPFVILFGIILAIFGITKYVERKQRSDENLDFVYSPAQVAKKAGKTVILLEFLARQDPAMAPEALRKQAETTFLKLQECWSARSYEPMRPLLMPELFREHSLQIAGMVRDHEINVIGDLRVDRIDLVNVRYTFKEEQREFTALITATACDYYLDDRTRRRLRGDTVAAQFQEFWTFQFHNKAWLLREVEQSRESEALKTENFFEQFTDKGVEQIYGKEAAQEGPAGPWLEKAVQIKETRIERMLNFLVQTDRIWDRQAMMETTRRVFLEMMAARESGNPANVPQSDLFPELAAHLKEAIAQNQAQGIAVEFRNLCVRKVELILVRNFADNTRDEFVARVQAHAQKILRRNGQVSRQDEDVVPFEQYLTLGRLNNGWRLKEILTAEAGQAAVQAENLDQDSSPDQVQWYYQHGRAV
jgi:uncharacterized membrane protein YgcG